MKNCSVRQRILDDELLEQLECPVCLEYMESHIKMCENGHNICSSCRSRVAFCPSCRGQFLPVRNIALENLARTAMYPCNNREAGCNEIFSVDERNDHQSKCPYQSRECPFKKLSNVKCSWTGALSNIVGHVRRDHGSEFIEKSGPFNLKLENICSPKHYRKVIFTFGTLFYLVWEIKDATFHFSPFDVAVPGSATEKLKYNFKLRTLEESISVCGICHSYLQDKSEVLQPGECVTLHYGTVLKYVGEDSSMLCEIEILRPGTGAHHPEIPGTSVPRSRPNTYYGDRHKHDKYVWNKSQCTTRPVDIPSEFAHSRPHDGIAVASDIFDLSENSW